MCILIRPLWWPGIQVFQRSKYRDSPCLKALTHDFWNIFLHVCHGHASKSLPTTNNWMRIPMNIILLDTGLPHIVFCYYMKCFSRFYFPTYDLVLSIFGSLCVRGWNVFPRQPSQCSEQLESRTAPWPRCGWIWLGSLYWAQQLILITREKWGGWQHMVKKNSVCNSGDLAVYFWTH